MTHGILITVAEVGGLAVISVLLYYLLYKTLTSLFSGKLTEEKAEGDQSAWYVRILKILMLLCFTISSLCLIGLNGYLISRGESVSEVQLAFLRSMPAEVWQSTAIAFGQCLALVLFAGITLRFLIRRGLLKFRDFIKNVDGIEANDEAVVQFFRMLDRVVSTTVWVGVAITCLIILSLPERFVGFAYWSLGTYLLISLGMLIAKAVPIAVDTLDALSVGSSDSYKIIRIYQRFRHLIPLLKRCLELIIYVITASLILRYSSPVSWLIPYVNKAAGIITIYFLTRVALAAIDVGMSQLSRQTRGLSELQQQRRATMIPLARSFSKYAIYLVSLVGVLGTLGVDPTPILAGAGIVGLAIGFGAQNLVEDIVSGLFVLFENYYLVGDYVAAGRMEERPVEGIVEAIELRTTRLRHPDGQVQIIRNGEIGSVVNYSKQYIYATVDIPLAYEEKLEVVYPIITDVGQQLKSDNPEMVLEPTKVEGLESLGKNLVLVRTITKVKPGQHLHIQRLLRKMLKDVFDQRGIELADYEPDTNIES